MLVVGLCTGQPHEPDTVQFPSLDTTLNMGHVSSSQHALDRTSQPYGKVPSDNVACEVLAMACNDVSSSHTFADC